jgi:hypothetical protein
MPLLNHREPLCGADFAEVARDSVFAKMKWLCENEHDYYHHLQLLPLRRGAPDLRCMRVDLPP